MRIYLRFRPAMAVGQQLGVNWQQVDPLEFWLGINVEVEHRGVVGAMDWQAFARIALDHLAEVSDYYTRLLAYVEKDPFWLGYVDGKNDIAVI